MCIRDSNSAILKGDFSLYAKADYALSTKFIAFADVQFRNVSFKSSGLSSDLLTINVNEKFNFFNPKAGLTYVFNNSNSIYGSVAVANREPNGDDLTKNPIQPKACLLYTSRCV